MNLYSPITNLRSHTAYKFSRLHRQALRNSIWSRLIGKKSGLASFPEHGPQTSPNRKFIGVEDIPVEQVIGTLNRHNDFDRQFRPLKSHLRDRWVNAYLALEGKGWEPIIVHKIADHYYVEDGHHRVSIARLTGMLFIQASVWEYTPSPKPVKKCQPQGCTERSSTRLYTAQEPCS